MPERREDSNVRWSEYRHEIFQLGRFAGYELKGSMSTAQSATATSIEAAPPKTLPRVGSAVIVIDGESVLLGVRNKEPHRGKWVLPGGKIRPFESIDDAA